MICDNIGKTVNFTVGVALLHVGNRCFVGKFFHLICKKSYKSVFFLFLECVVVFKSKGIVLLLKLFCIIGDDTAIFLLHTLYSAFREILSQKIPVDAKPSLFKGNLIIKYHLRRLTYLIPPFAQPVPFTACKIKQHTGTYSRERETVSAAV